MQRAVALIAYADGTVERVKITPKVQMYYERVYKTPLSKAAEIGNTAMFQLAWEAVRANGNGRVIPDFETWVDGLEAVDVELEDIRPTEPAPPGSSPTSPSPPA